MCYCNQTLKDPGRLCDHRADKVLYSRNCLDNVDASQLSRRLLHFNPLQFVYLDGSKADTLCAHSSSQCCPVDFVSWLNLKQVVQLPAVAGSDLNRPLTCAGCAHI